MPSIERLFASNGLLAETITGFAPREAQTTMAEAVKAALEKKEVLIVEAGTGTGKTFAYLVPALQQKGKVILSTGTKNLQEQLFHRDLPRMRDALASHKQLALLKGRSNYLCIHRLQQHSMHTDLVEKETLSELSTVRQWATTTQSGDISEITGIPEDARVLPLVTSTLDNCLGRDCPDYDECYLVKARKKAMEADVLVVNHHLFFADMALKDTGFGEIIPEAEAIIFDEAHQIPDIACDYFGEAMSTRQLQDMAKDITLLVRTVIKDAAQLQQAAEKCRMAAADLRLLFPLEPQKGNWAEKLPLENVQLHVQRLKEALAILYDVSKVHVGRDKTLDSLFDRVTELRAKWDSLCQQDCSGVSLWYETTPRHLTVHLTPLTIAAKFRQFVQHSDCGWVFTSATLVVEGEFTHFQRRMGLEEATTIALESPFDYQQQSLLCVPRFMPEPHERNVSTSLVKVAQSLIEASGGRCFLLFTSHQMLLDIAEKLSTLVTNPLLVQGQASKQLLLERFINEPNAVLLGTGAFWEGVDVRGNALVAVMIDKLPFASPDDPLLQARIEDAKKRGINPFAAIQIPQAVITLKQGAGRLIRDVGDKGVLVICDTRLVTKPYGKTFLASLPNMRRTRSLDKVNSFLADLNA